MEDHYNDASTSCVTYATSSTRDEPFVPSTGTTRYDPLGRLAPSTSYKFPKEFEHYQAPQSRPLVPGLTTRHTLTMEHPLVTRFLARVPSIPPALGRISGEDWWTKALHSWTVNGVLDLTDADGNEVLLSEFQEECIFVLAALKVFYYPRHPKHFAMWGKDWAARTAERIHALLLMKPCPIAYSYNWMSVEICLWMIEEHQSYTFGENKEGKKAANGMLLRKRKSGAGKVVFDPLAGKSIEGVTDERPKKRVRMSARTKKTQDNAAVPSREPEAETMLEALPLSGVVVSLEQSSSGSSTAVSPDSEAPPEPTKDATKLELMGVDAPQPASTIASSSSSSPRPSTTKLPPPTTRRSARQAHKHKRGETASPSTPSTHLDSPASEITSLAASTPPSEQPALPLPLPLSSVAEAETKGGSEERPVITRARSSSSSCASEVTVVSDAPSVESVVTVVAEEAGHLETKSKVVAMVEEIVDNKEQQQDKENGKEVVGKVRASGRTRRPAVKKVEAEDVKDGAAGAEKVVDGLPGVKGRSRRRVVGRR
ncbi:hypothetical protein BC629DRAFT_955787 [Irpex lacteus]|nr:hypothetical protein BC629DRAFT_955787 [Irpex lacteus]